MDGSPIFAQDGSLRLSRLWEAGLRRVVSAWRRQRLTIHDPWRGQPTLRWTICDRNPEVMRAFVPFFKTLTSVQLAEGSIFDLDADALVSPANSFGDMGGGIDAAIDDFYGKRAQTMAIKTIAAENFGELPVGSALILRLGGARFPYLVVAPTMRVPGPIADTLNPYLATRALLIAVLKHNRCSTEKIEHVAIPGLGTGVGKMPYERAAEQMRAAFDSVIGGGWKSVRHPALAPFASPGWVWRSDEV